MSELKRKRSSTEDSTAAAEVTDLPYFKGLPEGLAELADFKLLVEAQELPAHFVLTSKPPVFLAAVAAASKDSQRVCQVPLPGESKQGNMTDLKYLYQDTLLIESVSDAQILASFAHKYGMTQVLQLSGKYLVDHSKTMLGRATVFGWAQFAECHQLSMLLAHCERYIVLNFRDMSSKDKKLSSISLSSPQRIMDGLVGRDAAPADLTSKATSSLQYQYCTECQSVSRPYTCRCGNWGSTSKLQVTRVEESALHAFVDACVPSIDVFLKWQQA